MTLDYIGDGDYALIDESGRLVFVCDDPIDLIQVELHRQQDLGRKSIFHIAPGMKIILALLDGVNSEAGSYSKLLYAWEEEFKLTS